MSVDVADQHKSETFRTDLLGAGFRFHRTSNCWVKGDYHLSLHLLATLTISQFDQVMAAIRDGRAHVTLSATLEFPLRPLTPDEQRRLPQDDHTDDPPGFKESES